MIRIFFLSFFFVFLFFKSLVHAKVQVLPSTLTLSIAYPLEKAQIPFLKESFVFGAVSHPDARVWINGRQANVYQTGAYMAVLPFEVGEFTITAKAQFQNLETQTDRTVLVSSPTVPLPKKPLAIAQDPLIPGAERMVQAGDVIPLYFRGSPGHKAEYRIQWGQSTSHWKPMKESKSPVPGTYKGRRVISEKDKLGKMKIEYRLSDGKKKSVNRLAPGEITIVPKTFFKGAMIQAEEAVIRTGPSHGSEKMGYTFFLPQGVLLKVTGQIGEEVRVQFSPNLSGWTEAKNLTLLEENGSFPPATLKDLNATQEKNRTLLSLNLDEKIPYKLTVSDNLKQCTLTLFDTISNIDRIYYAPPTEDFLGPIRWFQTDENTVKIQINLKKKLWGYNVDYKDNTLICEIISAPMKSKKNSALKGLTIALDPGHSLTLGDGAISPHGILEGEINYLLSLEVKKELEKAGANVILTRQLEEIVSLDERKKRAIKEKADLFISMHANALPYGADPFPQRGYSVYYFQPQSFRLARAMHRAYQKRIPLPDEGVHYGNLAVCRITPMPSILTESAYLIQPRGEELLQSKKFQKAIAKTIKEGILNFIRQW